MIKFKYWQECLAESLSEHGVTVTPEQLNSIARDIESCSDNMGLAFYVPENPYISQIENLKSNLEKEKRKVTCQDCEGSGVMRSQGPHHGSSSACFKCNGQGKI
jgi:hypothetical protein